MAYEKAKPLTGIDLNYEIVGGTTPPTTFKKENTIWVNTSVNKEKEAEVTGLVELAYYIGSSNGKVTSSSNTVKTAYFVCLPNHEYNFKLDDAQTVVIAAFTAYPAKDVVGRVIYGSGSTTGLESLDYSVTITDVDEKFLAIYYYNSSTNTSMPNLTITDNTIKAVLPDEIPIKGHAFDSSGIWEQVKDVDYIPTSLIIQDKYLSDSGAVTTGDGSNAPCYTENYIPVSYGTTYDITYTLSISKSMWFAICEYTGRDGKYTFKKRTVSVNSVTGTSKVFTYTPSASDVTYVRLSWRTFYPSGAESFVSFIHPEVDTVPYLEEAENLFTTENCKDGVLLDRFGLEDTSLDYFRVSDYIELPKNTYKVMISETHFTTGATHAWYDSNKNYISNFLKGVGTKYLVPPKNAKYLRISQDKNKELDNSIVVKTVENNIRIINDSSNAVINFNAIKRNELILYPVSLRQWNGKSWKLMEGALYQNGTMTQFTDKDGRLYHQGTQFILLRKNAFDGTKATATFGTECIELVAQGKYGTNGAFAYVGTQGLIDFTPYTKMIALVRYSETGTTYNNANGFVMGVTDTFTSGVYNKGIVKVNLKNGIVSDEPHRVELDVSSVNGFYYPQISLSSYTSGDPTRKGYIYSWWLE